MSKDQKKRTIELSVEIQAGPDAVWDAISQGEGLRRWFPLEAEVTPGEGGSVTLSWGPGCEGTAPIRDWQPGRRLSWVEKPADPAAEPIAVEFSIQAAEGGKTTLRLVQSGFAAGEEWSEYIDVLDSGWRYFLFNLKHCLERHPGTPRRMVWERRKVKMARAEAWDRIFGPSGLASTPPPPTPGSEIALWDGTPGSVLMVTPQIHVAAQIPGLNDALLFLELEMGQDEFHLGTWLSLYGVDPDRARRLEESLRASLARVFP